MNPAFTAAYQGGENFAQAREEHSDKSALDSILSKALSSRDPEVYQQSIGAILSKVSPARQGVALQVLNQRAQFLEKKLQEDLKRERTNLAYEEQGLPQSIQHLPPGVQSQVVRGMQPQKMPGGVTSQPVPEEISKAIPDILEANQNSSSDELASAFDSSGIPRVYSNSYIENRRRQDEQKSKVNLQEQKDIRKFNTDISKDILKENEKEAQGLIQTESALNLMEDAIANKDMSFFTLDNLAEKFGIEGLRSKEGALFKTAGKEFFLGNISRAGARPNQFIEKQVVEMLPKIGRSTAANLSVARAFRNESDLKKEKIRITRELAQKLESELGYVPKNLGQLRDEKLKIYAEDKQKELNNDLRAIKAIDEKNIQPFDKVKKGTPISKVVAKAILNQFDKKDSKRVEKAQKVANNLGYQF
jgi:hypothetical protein